MLDCQIFKFVVVARVETTNVHRHTNLVKYGQTVLEISRFLIFKMAAIRHLEYLNFWLTIRLGSVICIAVPNITKIGQTVAEISHLTSFKMAAVRHLQF